MRLEALPATYGHVEDLAPRLRERDLDEVRAASGWDAHEALLKSLALSDPDMVWAAVERSTGHVVSMYGVGPLTWGTGSAWLLSSDLIDDYAREAWVLSKRGIAEMHTRYQTLTNFIDVRNVTSLSWLERLGFCPVEFAPAWGVERRPFIRYESVKCVDPSP